MKVHEECSDIRHEFDDVFMETIYAKFEKGKLYDGTYNRDKFYFKLDPFTFNDLDDISPDLLQFPGTMVTDGIFPDFKQQTLDKLIG